MSFRSIRGTTAVFVALLLAAATPVRGDDSGKALNPHGRLDGMQFVGVFGPESDPHQRKEDTLYFSDGHFWSAACVPCGFAPGVYWVRHHGDAIHFRGEMGSPERGRFEYYGVVQDGRLSASVNWRKERWYWTIDRDFRFEGKLSQVVVTERAANVARTAAVEGKVPKPVEICPL